VLQHASALEPTAAPLAGAMRPSQISLRQPRAGGSPDATSERAPPSRSPERTASVDAASALRRLDGGAGRGGGSPLEPPVRLGMELAFGRPLGQVRVHTDAEAGALSRDLDAQAVTWGHHMYFGPGAYAPTTATGRRLLAHELSHVLQSGPLTGPPTSVSRPTDPHEQRAARAAEAVGRGASPPRGPMARVGAPDGRVYRYKSGEHAEAGMIGSYLGPEESTYQVRPGELPAAIAARLGISVQALMERNRSKLRRWTTRSGRQLLGFDAGETIVVPTGRLAVRIPAASEPATPAPQPIVVAGVSMEYGEATAMGDFYAIPEAMLGAERKEVTDLLGLIRKERTGGRVEEEEWNTATGRRYMDLNLRNREHFAPAPGAATPSSPLAGVDHRASWLLHHHQALEVARKGDPARGLAINAFADHFLADAFAAGHLFNKQAVMDTVMGRLRTKRQKEAFAKAIADAVFADPTAAAFIAGYQGSAYGTFWDINSAGRFKDVLLGIDAEVPDVLPNAVAAAIHDELNATGVEVSNAKRTWKVKGDGSMEEVGRDLMRQAIAESYAQVANAAQSPAAPDLKAMDKAVWDLVPRPTAGGQKAIDAAVARLVDPTAAITIAKVAALVKENLKLLMESAVDRSRGEKVRRKPI
jgi:hypothetical protein